MKQSQTACKLKCGTRNGFALSELLIIVVILGVLSGPVIVNSRRDYDRDRVNAVITAFAAWLQVIQATATREGINCSVTVAPLNDLADGSPLATVTPTACSSESTFRINSSVGGSVSYNISGPTIEDPPLVFNRRGGISAGTDQIWTVQLVGSDVQRCIQLARGFGAIRLGVPGPSNECVAGAI